ncbi:MAG: AAA family ATPase [Deltaproteobacteria bacterium]|nr:AAA family ATPase [Deltaproteobacteria bacterium]
MEARGATDGERKTITALFADLKGSTALIEGLDPEEARAIIDPALQLMMDAVHRYEGYVAQALGDGIFALFGAPLAHEDHPQRALYAALRMQDEMRRYADTLRTKGYPPLLMRVGVNTGEVVVRSIRKDDLHTDYVPVGHSTNLAARMEQLAAPGSILVTEDTHKLTDGYFEFKALGKTQIKGVEAPLAVYEVLGAGPLRTRLQVSAHHGLTRFVGRQSELDQLQQALAQAKAGHGQIVGVMGEPGLGKSRLFYEFKFTSQSGCLILEAYSVSHGKASPYLPLIELLKNYFQMQPQDDERTRRQKVIGQVLELDRSLADTLPYLFALLSIEEQPSSLQQMDPQIRRRRIFEALKRLFLRESLNQPLLLIFEDLHWIDSETQGFLDTLSESVASTRILLLVNYRPEYRQEWGQKTYYTQLRLAPLGREEAEEFLDVLLGESSAPQVGAAAGRSGGGTPPPLYTLKQLILEKTAGTPFFMEEIVQELLEQGVLVRDAVGVRLRPGSSIGHVPLPTHLHIPPTVQGVLAARIDRLAPDEKTLLQQLAVIGREFPVSLLRQVIAQPEDELYRLLASLQHKEFLYEQSAFPEVEYTFKHALTQEVAYGTVLQERRKLLHERTAQALEALYAVSLDEHYRDLAHHYARSSNTQKAVDYLHLAGQQAVQRSASTDAVDHFTAALKLLETLPLSLERTQQELSLQIALGAPLLASQGLASSEAERAYRRARELCQQMGETALLSTVLWGLGVCSLQQGKIRAACEIAEQGLTLAQRGQDRASLMVAHSVLGTFLFFLGELSPARTHLEQGIALYDPQLHHSLAHHYWCDFGVLARGFVTQALRLLGYPDQALKRSREALTLAQELAHPQSLAFALYAAEVLHHFRRENERVQERAEAEVALAGEQGLPLWLAWGTMFRGWALAEQGEKEAGLVQLRQGFAAFRATGSGLLIPYCLCLLAETYGRVGQLEEGLSVLTEALAVVNSNEERWLEAEVYQLRGTLTLKQSGVQSPASNVPNTQHPTPSPQAEADAEACFLKAIEIARQQQAKSLELRATVSLARLWQQQGKQHTARQLLSDIYDWFTEGFDTKDLQEAKALLEALNRTA